MNTLTFQCSKFFMCLVIIVNSSIVFAQNDSAKNLNTFLSVEDALKSPENVFKLSLENVSNLSNAIDFSIFKNLEYLSLKNDHLNKLPRGIQNLKNLKILDLSGNDFKVLPKEISKLKQLNELYLNNDPQLNIDKSIKVLKGLPQLKKLHLENNGLVAFPKKLYLLNNLEELYINDNKIKQLPAPTTLKKGNKLQLVNAKNNQFLPPRRAEDYNGFGLRFVF